ncbi:hypothetical protein Hamer_G028496 [Homarus americanus]|uniref:Uncharacterized protein n=1 Tax=Homarus americanus TaxID=6706 RepID=A0A8J5TNW0_HOMAM|nr:hypothetical protein Hamer_G028496 [Homarus americanus]
MRVSRNNRISEEDKRRIIAKYETNKDFLITAADLGIKSINHEVLQEIIRERTCRRPPRSRGDT